MKLLGISAGLTLVLIVGFGLGIATQSTLPLFAAFCAWTPVAWLTGFAVARAGLRISVGDSLPHTSPFVMENVMEGAVASRRNKRPVVSREEFS